MFDVSLRALGIACDAVADELVRQGAAYAFDEESEGCVFDGAEVPHLGEHFDEFGGFSAFLVENAGGVGGVTELGGGGDEFFRGGGMADELY